jgi:hypothetical protein
LLQIARFVMRRIDKYTTKSTVYLDIKYVLFEVKHPKSDILFVVYVRQ